jgi:hypothetical protein
MFEGVGKPVGSTSRHTQGRTRVRCSQDVIVAVIWRHPSAVRCPKPLSESLLSCLTLHLFSRVLVRRSRWSNHSLKPLFRDPAIWPANLYPTIEPR